MLHDVHIYAIVRIKVEGVEATTHEEATDKAYEIVQNDLDDVLNDKNFRRLPPQVKDIEYADGVDGFLVVEPGDAAGDKDTWHNKSGERVGET